MRGRDGEWQWPASLLPTRDLVRGLIAMGFSGLTLDREGFSDNGASTLRDLDALLGPPIAERDNRLFAWDLRPAEATLLGNSTPGARQALAQQLLDAPRLYLSTDADPITTRGERHDICGKGSLTIVNPGKRAVPRELELMFTRRKSSARRGTATIDNRAVPISLGRRNNVITMDVEPGTTTIAISVITPGVRCRSVPADSLPSISATMRPTEGAAGG
jgi:hypothetical protein